MARRFLTHKSMRHCLLVIANTNHLTLPKIMHFVNAQCIAWHNYSTKIGLRQLQSAQKLFQLVQVHYQIGLKHLNVVGSQNKKEEQAEVSVHFHLMNKNSYRLALKMCILQLSNTHPDCGVREQMGISSFRKAILACW